MTLSLIAVKINSFSIYLILIKPFFLQKLSLYHEQTRLITFVLIDVNEALTSNLIKFFSSSIIRINLFLVIFEQDDNEKE